jgi:septal ring factor EnvC (AmiA/AmiB activator)
VDAGEPITGFSEFVQLWTKTNEAAFLEFFRTPEYSELQGVVLDTAVDCRQQFRQLTEKALADLPVALSSELDDLAKKNYDLNKTVRALKKKSDETDKLRAEVKRLQKRLVAIEKQLAAAEPPATGAPNPERAT